MKKAVRLMLSLFSALSLMFLSCSTDSSGGGSPSLKGIDFTEETKDKLKSIKVGGDVELCFQKVFSDESTEDVDYDLNKSDFNIIIKEGTNCISLNENVVSIKSAGKAKIKVIYQTKYSNDIEFDIQDSSEVTLTGIEIEPINSIAVDATKKITVKASYSDGSTKDISTDAEVVFVSSDNNVAVINDATLRGVGVGEVIITATYKEKKHSISVKVYESIEGKSLSEITISPVEKTLKSEESVEFVVTAKYSDNSEENVTDTATIKLDDETAGALDKNKFTAASVTETKTVKITASYEYDGVRKEATATVNVEKDVIDDSSTGSGKIEVDFGSVSN